MQKYLDIIHTGHRIKIKFLKKLKLTICVINSSGTCYEYDYEKYHVKIFINFN